MADEVPLTTIVTFALPFLVSSTIGVLMCLYKDSTTAKMTLSNTKFVHEYKSVA